MFQDLKHKHKWKYMFSSGDNEWNWFHCEECLAQCCCKLDMQAGTIEVQNFETKKADTKKR